MSRVHVCKEMFYRTKICCEQMFVLPAPSLAVAEGSDSRLYWFSDNMYSNKTVHYLFRGWDLSEQDLVDGISLWV